MGVSFGENCNSYNAYLMAEHHILYRNFIKLRYYLNSYQFYPRMPPKKKKIDIKAAKINAKEEQKKQTRSASKSQPKVQPKPTPASKTKKRLDSPPPLAPRSKPKKESTPPKKPEKKPSKPQKKQEEKKVQVKDVKKQAKKPQIQPQELVKAILKGGVAVDSLVPNKDTFRVFQEGGKIYGATLNQANMVDNNNKFYIVQILYNEKTGAVSLWTRWGRVGVSGQNCLKGPLPKDAAIRQYTTKIHDKTVKGDYKQIQIKYDDGEDEKPEEKKQVKKSAPNKNIASKIDAGLQKFINLIFDTKIMDTAMKQIGYDAKKMPLGKLGDSTIKQAYTVLNKITKQIKGENRQAQLAALSGQFFTLIPHNLGFDKMSKYILRNQEQVKDKIRTLQAISDMKITTKLLNKEDDSQTAVIDQNYKKLGCSIKTLNKNEGQFKLIKEYFDNTKGGHAKVSVGDIYEIKRPTEYSSYNQKIGNNVLLWHGSRITNFVGILSQGLRIAPPQAPVSGYLFGKGIYLADLAEKSINYCRSHGSDKALILLIEGAIGNPNVLLTSNCQAKQLMQKNGKDSTKCWGAKAPPQSCYIKHNNMIIPNGAPKPTSSGSYMGHNQFIVYNMNQARIRYIIEMDMNGN